MQSILYEKMLRKGLIIEEELDEYQVYKKGQIIKFDSIAYDLYKKVKDWNGWFGVSPIPKEIKDIVENKKLNFSDVYYCCKEEKKRNQLIIFDNCSKIFSRFLFEITAIFQSKEEYYLLLNDKLVLRINENTNVYTSDIILNHWKRAFIEEDDKVLSDIIYGYKCENMGLFSDYERLNLIEDIYCRYLIYFQTKYIILL